MKYRGKIITRNLKLSGFALPTVMIASLVMFIVLLAAVSATVSIRTSLNDQYYNKLAQSAADAGAAYAKACLAGNEGKQTWSSKLVTGTRCDGVRDDAFCAADSACNYVYTDNQYIRTSFEVKCTGTCAQGTKPENLEITGKIDLLRGGLGVEVWRQYSQVARLSRIQKNKKQIAIGFSHACAIAFDSRAYCWGANGYGVLGIGTTDIFIPVPILIKLPDVSLSVESIAAGSAHTCAIMSDQKVYCWGSNANGQLGVSVGGGNVRAPATAVDATNAIIPSTQKPIQIAAGDRHTCMITSDGTTNQLYCWGSNAYGQLGDNLASGAGNVDYPVRVTSLDGLKVSSIALGHSHTCAIDKNGRVFCWGRNGFGQLGINNTTQQNVPSLIYNSVTSTNNGYIINKIATGLTNSGNADHICAIITGNTMSCWGRNNTGQLGDSLFVGTQSNIPRAVSSGGIFFKSVTVADFFTCGLTTLSRVYCWGRNNTGQLGNNLAIGTPAQVNAPGEVYVGTAADPGAMYGKDIASIAAGSGYACVIDSELQPYCWGDGTWGQFGNNTSGTDLFTPTPISLFSSTPVKAVTPQTVDYYF